MRIALVDLLFSWPPHGGADVDLFQTASELQRSGHDVHLFVATEENSWERGTVDVEALPFPATSVPITGPRLNGPAFGQATAKLVDHWQPDVVFIGDGFFLKPFVIKALNHYPTVGRYYAHEAMCIRDILRFKDGAPCPMHFAHTPNECRRCAVSGMRSEILRGRPLVWAREFLQLQAHRPDYHLLFVEALASLDAIIVYNEHMKRDLSELNSNVHIVPGGVCVSDFVATPPSGSSRKTILMAGRVEDPLKGLATLMKAGELLAGKRDDFVIQATHTDHSLNTSWFEAIGWRDHAGMRECYQNAYACVVPSIWEEPFGLVAVEAMASGRPVCASRVGGLQSIIVEEETGFLFEREDAEALALQLERLLDEPALCERMGVAARRRAEEIYDWSAVIERCYPPLWESMGL